jgi:polyisoprenyl-phosphate glycosyltransferase
MGAQPQRRAADVRRIKASAPRLSIVAPCFNEALGLPKFVARMAAAARAAVGEDFELILVNDGSRDSTWSVICDLKRDYPQVIGVNLARNHGHQLAVTAGLSLVRGARTLIIDADLQDPPELLSAMMARMDEGYDVVYGQRRGRDGESAFKLATAKIFYRLLNRISDVDIPQDVGDFRLISRRVVERLNAMPERDRFLRGMVAWLGGRQSAILYDRDARVAGQTGYTLSKMVRLAVAGLTGFSSAPLKLAVFLAFAGAFAGVCLTLYAFAGLLSGRAVAGWTSLSMLIVFFGSGQFFCLAIIGAYVGRIFVQVKGRPMYMIDEVSVESDYSEGESYGEVVSR